MDDLWRILYMADNVATILKLLTFITPQIYRYVSSSNQHFFGHRQNSQMRWDSARIHIIVSAVKVYQIRVIFVIILTTLTHLYTVKAL